MLTLNLDLLLSCIWVNAGKSPGKTGAASISAMETFKNKPEYSTMSLGCPLTMQRVKELTKSAKKVCLSSRHG